jgi:hypothetical protein
MGGYGKVIYVTGLFLDYIWYAGSITYVTAVTVLSREPGKEKTKCV